MESDEAELYTYEGVGLRIMWDEDAGPLWGDEGLLGEEAEWMRRALGLSEALIDDLQTWMRHMTALRHGPHVSDWSAEMRRLEDRRGAMEERLAEEVGARFEVLRRA